MLAQQFEKLYPIIKLDEDEYDPDKTYDHMVDLYRDGRCVRTIYGPKIIYSAKKREISIWHIDQIPDLVYETDASDLLIAASGPLDLSRFPNLKYITIEQMDPNLIELNRPLPSLKWMSLTKINDDFPKWLRFCPNLEVLWIWDSKISQLPDWVSELPIKKLLLKSLPMKDLPEWLPQLPLIELEIENLPLDKIPEVLKGSHLLTLELGQCGISEIPDWIGDGSYYTLKLNHNNISKIPPTIGSGNELDLSYNQISELPSGIWADKSFYRLDLSHNKIRELPADFGEMEIQELKLNHNPIEELPHFKYYKRDILDLSQTNLQYPMFWKQDHTWLKKMSKVIVPDWWDKEMIYAARRLIGFPKYPIYTYTEYLEYSRLRHG